MFDSSELPELDHVVQEAMIANATLLQDTREEVRPLAAKAQPIRPRSVTSVSFVASDGGNNKLVFDPFHLQLVRVVDSYGRQICLEAVTPVADTDALSAAQFDSAGAPRTALGRMMIDLSVCPPTLNQLSHMIPTTKQIREGSTRARTSWVLVFRDLCEWAALYDRVCHEPFAADTILVRDGLLRCQMFRGDLFFALYERLQQAITRIRQETYRKVFLVGVAKHSKVLQRYELAMTLENTLPAGEPWFVEVPRELERKAYEWPDYARGIELEGESGEAPRLPTGHVYAIGHMYFVRFGKGSRDPIWSVDVFSSQRSRAGEIFGYLLADAVDGFPVPLYPRCLQDAHEAAQMVGLDMKIAQRSMYSAIKALLTKSERAAFEELEFQVDVSGRRYKK